MKEFCENQYCENPGAKMVPVSVKRASDQQRTLCVPCEEAYTWGVQHGTMTAQAKPLTLPDGDADVNRPVCHQCGGSFRIDAAGIANHIRGDGAIDHDLDADHVPYQIQEGMPVITRIYEGKLQILCCPTNDRTGQPGITRPDVVGCGSSNLTREGDVIQCNNCGIWIEGQEHGQWQDAITVHLTPRELATVLAALRFHQAENLQGDSDIPDQFIRSIATDVGRFTPLSGEEIDVLCIRLNRGEPHHMNKEQP